MQQQIAPIPCKPWTLNGLSDRLIVSHYEDTYGADVRAVNAIRDRLATLDFAHTPPYEVRSLKREELAALSSVRLHELYFGSLRGDGAVLFTGSGDGIGLPKPVAAALEQQFGSAAAWQREFIALARTLGGRSGWVVLSHGREDGELYNQIVDDGSPVVIDAAPLLVLDMYEHAYHQEFGANATAYVDAFMRNVDWLAVARRLTQAAGRAEMVRSTGDTVPSITVEELMARRARAEPLQIVDARPTFHFSRFSDMMDGATYRNPDQVYEWSTELAPDTPVLVCCAYGFNVGCAVANVLRDRGFDARFLRGGLSAWFGAGGARMRRSDPQLAAA